MKKNTNKLIIFIILLVISIIGYEIYNSLVYAGIDRNSYTYLVEGEGMINKYSMIKEKKYKLKPQDKIKTIGEHSLVIIKWGDGSITRLGGNSEIIVKENDIDKDLLNIKISFKLERGKTWSNIVSFVGGNSYFYQEFADTTAAVRGTIYEVNLEKNYVYVDSHEIELRKNGKKKIIPEKKPFNIKKFSFIELLEFLKKYRDQTWENLNKNLDKQVYNALLKKVKELNNITNKKLNDLTGLNDKEKKKLYIELKKQYQELNFLKPDSPLYNQKLEIKKDLIKLSSNKEKQDLLTTSLYDFNDIVKSKNYNFLKTNLEIIGGNINELKNISNINLNNYINKDLIKKIEIPEGLKNEFQKNFNKIGEILGFGNIDLSNNKVTEFINFSTQNFQNQIKQTNGILDKIKEILGLKK